MKKQEEIIAYYQEDREDIYVDHGVDDLLQDDELKEWESGFMIGFNSRRWS